MFKPEVLVDLAATLPITPEAAQWVEHIRFVASVLGMCLKMELDPKYEDILANFETTFNALMERYSDVVHNLKTHVIVSHIKVDNEDTGESMFN